jgi:predicted amidohydrolase YtcJ
MNLALVGAAVRTLDPAKPSATAVAVRDGTIAAVGSDAEIRELCDARTEVVDLGGAAVVPGLIDSHMHPFMGALTARGADLLGVTSLEEVLRRVGDERARCAPGEWVLGWGLEYNALAGVDTHGALFEEATGGAPMLLTYMDFHTALASPRALQLAGVTGPRTFEEHAEVVCVDGAPTGELRERAAMDLVHDAMPELTAEQRYRLCAQQLRRLAAVGITGTHAMDGDLSTHELLRELEGNGDLVTRIVTPFWFGPESTEAEWAAVAPHRDARGRRWKGGSAKFFIDGVIDSGTGWLYEPDALGDGTEPFWPDPAHYRAAVKYFASRGYRCATHATGDRGVREALDTYAQAGAAPGVRHRVEHVETLQPSDLPRFAAQGVVASMQAQHMMWLDPERRDNWSRRLGDDRCDRAFLTRSLLESGATIALGSDWPVARYDPREGMAAARLRRPPGHPDRAPYDDQALNGLQALHGYTAGAALSGGDGDRLGRLAPGYLADITVMAQDPVDADSDDLIATPVTLTVVDGEVVFGG